MYFVVNHFAKKNGVGVIRSSLEIWSMNLYGGPPAAMVEVAGVDAAFGVHVSE